MPRFSKNPTFYFWLFILLHTLLWTLGPLLFRSALPHDTLEGITWGLQWQLGYSKHPFLTAWLCAGFTKIFNSTAWPIYFLAQIAVSTTFVAVWILAKKMLPRNHALIAALLLEGVLFNNINSFNFTPDTLQSPLWVLLSLFFYQAITTQRIIFWLCTGLLAAFCLHNVQARQSFKKPGIYIAILTFGLLITPHLFWLYKNQFITFTYAQNSAAEYTQNKTILSHLTYPLSFFINCMLNVIGVFLLLWPFYNTSKTYMPLNQLKKQFLFYISLGPFFITLLLCFISGDYFPPRWATPYFFGLGILALAYLKPVITKKNTKQFAVTLIIFSSLLFTARMLTLTLIPRAQSDAYLPNQSIANYLAKLWNEHYQSRPQYIVGSNYLVTSIVPYMQEKPIPYLNWDQQQSPWVQEQELKRTGALFVWDEGGNYAWDTASKNNTHLPADILIRFPELKILPNQNFHRLSDNHTITIGVALLPPQK